MKRAHLRDAARTQKFHFRQHIAPPPEDAPTASVSTATCPAKAAETKNNATMSNTEREMAAAIAGNSTPCGPCNAKVFKTRLVLLCFAFALFSVMS